ncbi:DeoR/GlpR family DNA-binding transcription regulator [Roseomonas sp. E05]|uniref:DeoR/GlpR family DNA-binding transcription regulator n=1 Tax=Roseomonas sp. E05 TaxID=3046310 RepID=UPI0024BB9E76|nr:DeoR/GlpR family DNA-binding transcription regulator [Roseomonas sp. E05]MDJ0389992.1 DeoR/GlpR family DNA-binding transcription regulator [Roseomonas sp. E05]
MAEGEASEAATGLASMRRRTRIARLQELLRQNGTTRLDEAAQALGVSSMTLRRDLAVPGQPLALLGGHVVPAGSLGGRGQYVLEREQDSHAEAKRQACRHAARHVEEGDTIFVDCGTTLPHLIEALPPRLSLTIVCYALNIANPASRRPNTQLVLLGGLFHATSATFASDEALHALRRLRINKAFISAGGVHATGGVTCTNFNEVPVKQVAMAAAAQSFLVVDGSKFGRLRPAYFAPLSAFARILTDAAACPEAAGLPPFSLPLLDAAPAGS